MATKKALAIIGAGPRGGYALERVVVELISLKKLNKTHISIFESTGQFGNGEIYHVVQNQANWLNINERLLDLPEREEIKADQFIIEPFPSYHDWIGEKASHLAEKPKDIYPQRAKLGRYLSQRFNTLAVPLLQAEILTLHTERVIELSLLKNKKIQLNTNQHIHLTFDQVLLTIGHQPTEWDDEIKTWKRISDQKQHISLFTQPYPLSTILTDRNVPEHSTIAIRGIGLAMIDVVRAIATKIGHFNPTDVTHNHYRFVPHKPINHLIIPFSLDGLPPVPKPLNAKVDEQFTPSKEALCKFGEAIGNKAIQSAAKSPRFLVNAFAPIAANVYLSIHKEELLYPISEKQLVTLIIDWLFNQHKEHELIISTNLAPTKIMRTFTDMALGKQLCSLDYCIGQVWRHCQPTMYKHLAFNRCSDQVIADIIDLDESTKRYSYGPPVESIQQLIALSDANILSFHWAKNPNIRLEKKGWSLTNKGQQITANIMIDSVLPSPKIKTVTTPLINHLLSDDLIQLVHTELGATTTKYGYLIPENEHKELPIALIGRLAKGTVIGTDAILECFGHQPQTWAKQVALEL